MSIKKHKFIFFFFFFFIEFFFFYVKLRGRVNGESLKNGNTNSSKNSYTSKASWGRCTKSNVCMNYVGALPSKLEYGNASINRSERKLNFLGGAFTFFVKLFVSS